MGLVFWLCYVEFEDLPRASTLPWRGPPGEGDRAARFPPTHDASRPFEAELAGSRDRRSRRNAPPSLPGRASYFA
jgi:hypothetical protein